MNRFILFGFFILFNGYSYVALSQIKAPTHLLAPVSIKATKDLGLITSRSELLDTSAYARLTSSSIADLLNREAGLFIKSYGAGALSTISLRGSAAAHSAVNWHGFNLQSPMHGVTDLSLIPAFFIDDVKVQYGGNGTVGGSGSLGGAIYLGQRSIYNKGWLVNLISTAGSFNHFREGIGVAYGGKKFTSQTRLYHEQSKNNFSFLRAFDFDKTISLQPHASYNQSGFLQDNTFFSGKQQFGIHAFYLQSFKEIPPLMNATQSIAEQRDANLHISANWQLEQSKYTMRINAGYLTEKLNYNDSITHIYSRSNACSYLTTAEVLVPLSPNEELIVNIHSNQSEARADGYKDYKTRTQLTTSISYQLRYKERLTFLSAISKELAQGKKLPFLPSAGIHYLINKNFSVKSNIASVYRLPTLNDLYWKPGGNIDLQPEEGFASDVTIAFTVVKNNVSFKIETGTFYNKINNWIIWLPGEQQIWSPDNLNKVWSRGSETSGEFVYAIGKLQLRCKANYQYTLSTNEKVRPDAIASLNKQLIYTPRIQSKIINSISFRGFELHYNHSYTGYRYVSADNEYFIPPYTVAEAGILKSFYLKHVTLQCSISIENVWNEEYQVIAFYAMPGRHYETGLMVKFN